jgi:hypothetical protein
MATRPQPQQVDHAQRWRSTRHAQDQSRGGSHTLQSILVGMTLSTLAFQDREPSFC